MAGSPERQDAATVIEGAICAFDLAEKQTTGDLFYIGAMERLFDRYHFHDEILSFADDLEKDGVAFIEEAIRKDLDRMPEDVLVKIVGAVYRSIKRHTIGRRGSREYVDFIHQHVGIPAATGVRVLPNPF